MKYDKFTELVDFCIKLPHYQHKDIDHTERVKLAIKSFQRLTTADQKLVYDSWHNYCDKNKITFDMKEAMWYRFLAQTNLFFLCRLLEKYSGITVETHEEICNEFFVSKDPANFESFERFASSYAELKERLLLVPRGGFKSSIDVADCVQWIICFPEITILILTGVYDLAKDFVGELRGHFLLDEVGLTAKGKTIYGPKTMPDSSQSLFQILFPEHCINDKGAATEFQTPACKMTDKEPTVRAAGIEQNLSGWHFGILKLDDVVTNENCLTIGRMESVIKQVNVNKAMLHPFGFIDKIGTWYDEADVYGVDIKYEEMLREKGEPATMKIYLRAGWWPTDECKKAGKIEEEMKEEDWILWFPKDANGIPRLTYKFLLKEKKKDPEGFAIKYLNDPRQVHQIKFPRELLLRRTIPSHTLPPTGMIVTVFDTAYSTKNFADYTVGVTALIHGGRFYVIDISRGRYNDIELPQIIANTGYKWKPKRIAIEDSVGVRWLNREIRREMDKLGINIPVEYVSLGLGTKAKSKEIKAKPVQRLLGDERLFFSSSSSCLEECYAELEKFPKGTHDDVVSALSILVDQFAAYADMDARVNFVNRDFVANQRSKEVHDLVYGLGRYLKHNANFAMDDNPVLPKSGVQPYVDPPDNDPLKDLF